MSSFRFPRLLFSSLRSLRSLRPRRPWAAAALFAAATSACGQQGVVPTSSASGAGGDAAASSGSGAGGGGGGGGSVVPKKALTILDWNTHNFFDTTGTIGVDALSGTDYPKKRKSIGATLKALDADVIALAEVENKAVLDDLNTNELGGAYTTASIIDTSDVREIAILSRVPVDKIVSHDMDKFVLAGTPAPSYTYTRDCVEVHLTYNGKKVILLAVHFRSKNSPDDPDKRLAEAQHTRAIADELAAADPTAAIVVLGDFNDTPGSPPYAAVQGAAPTLFTDAADQVPDASRYSYVFQNNHELIDHQMGNPIMAAALYKSSVVLEHGAGIDDDSKYASDHTPLRAVYNF